MKWQLFSNDCPLLCVGLSDLADELGPTHVHGLVNFAGLGIIPSTSPDSKLGNRQARLNLLETVTSFNPILNVPT